MYTSFPNLSSGSAGSIGEANIRWATEHAPDGVLSEHTWPLRGTPSPVVVMSERHTTVRSLLIRQDLADPSTIDDPALREYIETLCATEWCIVIDDRLHAEVRAEWERCAIEEWVVHDLRADWWVPMGKRDDMLAAVSKWLYDADAEGWDTFDERDGVCFVRGNLRLDAWAARLIAEYVPAHERQDYLDDALPFGLTE